MVELMDIILPNGLERKVSKSAYNRYKRLCVIFDALKRDNILNRNIVDSIWREVTYILGGE